MMTGGAGASKVGSGMDRYGRRAVTASAIGYGLDGFDLLILSFALSGIIADFGIGQAQAGALSTWTLWGAVLGGVLFGIASDRWGRVRVLTWSVVFFAVFTGLSCFAPNYGTLAVLRFLAGIGIGGEFGIGMTLAAEAVPARFRARATSWVGIGFQCGVLAAALLSAPIIAAFGWRGLFAVGALPALVAIVLRSRLEESPRFLAQAQQRREKAGAPAGISGLRGLVADAATARISAAMIVLTSVQNFGYFGIITWLPRYLSTQRGLSLTGSSLWTAVTVLGMMCGILCFGWLADRYGRRPAFWTFQLGAAASVLLYSQLSSAGALLVGGFVMGIFANGMIGGYGALMAELYPTAVRATAQNVLFNIGRGVGGLAPAVIGGIAAAHGFPFALALLPGIYLLAFATMFLVPDRRTAELV
ncbi:MFS transporter [Rothia kristinae]|uniref:MFS transporter n=2 Tax=Rothia kristinae TaxID=37923 RepID=A0A1S2MZK5_9MICC|nr:MFS transporter [Rothia kristinae]